MLCFYYLVLYFKLVCVVGYLIAVLSLIVYVGVGCQTMKYILSLISPTVVCSQLV